MSGCTESSGSAAEGVWCQNFKQGRDLARGKFRSLKTAIWLATSAVPPFALQFEFNGRDERVVAMLLLLIRYNPAFRTAVAPTSGRLLSFLHRLTQLFISTVSLHEN